MNRVVVTILIIIAVITAILVGSRINEHQQYEAKVENNLEENEVIIGQTSEEIYDDCTDEWESNNNQEKETLQVNSNYEKEEKYILREKDDKIIAYKIDENGEEIEYLATDISTDYLAEDDKQNLQKRNDS